MASPSPPATKTDTARMRAAVWTPETSPPEESGSSSVSSTPPSGGGRGGSSLKAGRWLRSIRNTGPEGADAAVGAAISAVDRQSARITAMGGGYVGARRRVHSTVGRRARADLAQRREVADLHPQHPSGGRGCRPRCTDHRHRHTECADHGNGAAVHRCLPSLGPREPQQHLAVILGSIKAERYGGLSVEPHPWA